MRSPIRVIAITPDSLETTDRPPSPRYPSAKALMRSSLLLPPGTKMPPSFIIAIIIYDAWL